MTVCQRRLVLSEAEDTRLEKYSFFGRLDELVVLVAERLEGGPVSSRVSTFPDVFGVAKGGPKWRSVAENYGFDGEFVDDGSMFV